MALTPGGRYAWITNTRGLAPPSDNLAVIDTLNQIPVAVVNAETLPQPPSCATGGRMGGCRHPAGIAINPCPALANAVLPCAARNGDTSGSVYAYVTNPPTNNPNDTTASVTVIDVNAALTYPSSSIVSTVLLPAGSLPSQLAVTPDGTQVWVMDDTGLIWVIDTGLAITSPNTAILSRLLFPQLTAFATADGTNIWVTESSSIILTNLAMTPAFGIAFRTGTANFVGVGLLGSQAWVLSDLKSAGQVIVFNTDPSCGGCPVVDNPGIPVGGFPIGIAFTSDRTLALVTNRADNTVSVINTGLRAVVATIPTGSDPIGIAIQGPVSYTPSGRSTGMPSVPIGFTVTGADASLVGSVNWEPFGNTTVVQTTSTLSTSYTYAAPGTFPARVTVLDKSGATLLTETVPIVVQSPLQAIRTAEGLSNLALSPSSLQTSLLNDLSGAYAALEVGNRSAAFNDINLYVNQLTNYVKSLLTPSRTATAALAEGEAIAAALKPPLPILGAGQLAPEGGSSAVGQPVTFTAKWTVPDGKSWRSLQHVDLRLVAKEGDGDDDLRRVAGAGGDGNNATPLPIALWARFNVGEPSTFQLLDDNENVVGSGEPGSAHVLETSTAKLYLADSSFQGSGPTGPSVTVNFAVSFAPGAIRGNAAQPYQSQLLASDVLQGVQGPDQLGHWTVRPVHHD